MAQELIAVGAANEKQGDTPFVFCPKINRNFAELYAQGVLTKQKIVNNLADLPSAVSSVITLAANTKYYLANDLDLSTSRIVYGANSALDGLGPLTVSLSYIGTLPMFTMLNTSNSVSNINAIHPNSPLFAYSDNGSNVLRVADVTYTGSSIGTFGGTNSAIRLTNFSGSSTSDGMLFTGNWRAFLFEPTGSTLSAGKYIDLGSATFDTIRINETGLNYVSGVTFLSGLANSGNINAGGLGLVASSALSGAGTPLVGITANDDFWEFSHNNKIQDTKSSGILTLQGNTTQTVVGLVNTAVLVAGTWDVGETSQFAGTVAGRLTYGSSKPSSLPATISISVEPAASTGIKISAYVAIDGVKVAASKSSGTASAGGPAQITIPYNVAFTSSKYIEIYVENNTNPGALLVSSAILRV